MAKKVFEHEFTGVEDLSTIFKELPAKYGKKPVISTFRKAARPFVKQLRGLTPSATGETKKSIGIKAGRSAEYPSIQVGFRGGKYMPTWFKAYWNNYGTLANRDPQHSFVRGRKSKTATRQGGIRAKRFVEQAWDSTSEQSQRIVEDELKNETIKFLQKHAVR